MPLYPFFISVSITSGLTAAIEAICQYNTELLNDVTAHAEMQAITAAANMLGGKYLIDCTMYVTLEPCPMCAGAIVMAKIDNLFFGAFDNNIGGCGSAFNITSNEKMNHIVNVYGGIMDKECAGILKSFFEVKR